MNENEQAWVNVYRRRYGGDLLLGQPYASEEEARAKANAVPLAYLAEYKATTKICWEERR